MRAYSINMKGRVKNFSLPKNRPLVPLYEAVVNSIHSIKERREMDCSFEKGSITIDVIRSSQLSIGDNENLPIESFKITDNGIGFNEENMKSFLESDSTYKAEIGGKGVGRFSWLKAFKSVQVSSVFQEELTFYKRDFLFDLVREGIDDKIAEDDTNDVSTTIVLDTYLPSYSDYVPKQISTIANKIIQHCLVYFLDDHCPQIIIRDSADMIHLNSLFKEKFKIEENMSDITIEDENFHLLHLKIEDRSFQGNRLYLCANHRLVDSKDLEKIIVDLDSQIFERYGFWYIGVLTGDYLDNNVDMNRLSFTIMESGKNLLHEISMENIVKDSCMYIKGFLEEYLKPIADEKLERIKDYTISIAPQFRHLLKYMPDKVEAIKPNLSEDQLDDALYEIKRRFDKQAQKDQKKLFEELDQSIMNEEEYEIFFKEQMEKISDANSAVLAEYVTHRRIIIELFERGLRRQEDGKFNKEKYMHNLIYPMKGTSDDISHESHNLWLIDEKLSYCNFISSDLPFDNDYDEKRLDIMMLDHPVAVSDDKNDGSIFDTIIIFELKRPMRMNYSDSDNPITQLYDYVRKIRNGKAKDKYHRPIRVSETTKFYLYAVCDITPQLTRFIEQFGFTATPDSLGYYSFNKIYNAYFEILSFDKIVNDARKRNRVLFDKLGLK